MFPINFLDTEEIIYQGELFEHIARAAIAVTGLGTGLLTALCYNLII